MQTPWGIYLGVGLMMGGLLTGCQSTGIGQDDQPAAAGSAVDNAAPEGLDNILASRGFQASNIVLRTVLPVPAVTNGVPGASTSWEGRFAGLEQGSFAADDRVLVLASNRDTPRYRFSAPLRTWSDTTDKRETEWQNVWFCGTFRDFLRTVRVDRASRVALSDELHETAGGPGFPVQMTASGMRTNLVEIGLTTLDAHLKSVHADGSSCAPAVHFYVIPSTP